MNAFFAITFLQPWAVWFLVGIPLIVLLYLLRLNRRSVSVSTHLFWQRILQESSRRAFFHRLRHLLSLLLQLLVFLLIVGALARPLFRGSALETGSTILLIDIRARMQAVEADGSSRFAKAIALARSYVRQANTGAQFALLTQDRGAGVLVPFTDDERTLANALDRLVCTDAPGDLVDGLELARALVAGKSGNRRIIVLTDRQLTTEQNSAIPINVHALGSGRENVAITRFASRSHPANPATAELLLEVQNFGTQPQRSELELQFDGRVFDVKSLDLNSGEKRVEWFSSVPRPVRGSRGWLSARLKASDSLNSDNVAYATIPLQNSRRVLLVSDGNPFLEKLLAVDPTTKFELLGPNAWSPEYSSKFEAVIFDRFVPPSFVWEAATGNFLFLGATPFSTNGPGLDRPLVTELNASHPITRNVRLQNIAIQKAIPLVLPAAAEGWTFTTPLWSFDNPLLIAGAHSRGRIVSVAFDLLESDLPLRVAFPLLITKILQWLDPRASLSPPFMIAGDSLPLTASQSVSTSPLTSPSKPVPPLENHGVFQPLHNGFYPLADSAGQRWIAVNTFSAEESDLRMAGSESPVPSHFSAVATSGQWPLWFWLTLGAIALLSGEWWLFHRRKTE